MKIVRQGDLEPEGDLAFLLVHPLINQTLKKHLIRCIVRIAATPMLPVTLTALPLILSGLRRRGRGRRAGLGKSTNCAGTIINKGKMALLDWIAQASENGWSCFSVGGAVTRLTATRQRSEAIRAGKIASRSLRIAGTL
jgi:hypothetical protein